MKLRFRQSGGLAGLVRGCELDDATLGAEESRTLHELVDRAGLTADAAGREPAARDAQVYEIELVREGTRVRVGFDDGTMPKEWAPLVAYLQRRAGPRPLDD